jgi:hypothetical protein
MIKLLGVSRSPAIAAAGSGVLILTALVGVVLAAGTAASPSAAPAPTSASGPLSAAPLVLPKPCLNTKHRQACAVAATKQHRAKQVKGQPVQSSALPAPTAVPNPTSP